MPYKDPEKQKEAVRHLVQKGRLEKKITEKITLIKETTIEDIETDEEFTFNSQKDLLVELTDVFTSYAAYLDLSTRKLKSKVSQLNYSSIEDYICKVEWLMQRQKEAIQNTATIIDMAILQSGLTSEELDFLEAERKRYDRWIKAIEKRQDDFILLKEQGKIPFLDRNEYPIKKGAKAE